jgi:hypothetical protein
MVMTTAPPSMSVSVGRQLAGDEEHQRPAAFRMAMRGAIWKQSRLHSGRSTLRQRRCRQDLVVG